MLTGFTNCLTNLKTSLALVKQEIRLFNPKRHRTWKRFILYVEVFRIFTTKWTFYCLNKFLLRNCESLKTQVKFSLKQIANILTV